MLSVWFCGFDGFECIEKFETNAINTENLDKREICINAIKTSRQSRAPIGKASKMKIVVPEKIGEINADQSRCCATTLNQILFIKSDGEVILSPTSTQSFLSSKIVKATSAGDKIVTMTSDGNVKYMTGFDDTVINVTLDNRDPILHIGGTDQDIIVCQDKKIRIINIMKSESQFIPREMPFKAPVRSLSCGKEHTVFLTESGLLYSFGTGSRGQLGHRNVDNKTEPCLIDTLTGVSIHSVACGGWHSTAVSGHGDLYVWGWNENGQLGLPCRNISTTHPPTTDTSDNITFTVVTPDSGDKPANLKWFTPIYLETSQSSQVYIQKVGPIQLQPEPIALDLGEDLNVVKVSCGSRHSAVVTDGGVLLTCGWNDYGQLCHGDQFSRDYLQSVEYFSHHNLRVVDVFCGPWSTLPITEQV